jgi:hypothetical protein
MPFDFPDDVLLYNLPLEPEERLLSRRIFGALPQPNSTAATDLMLDGIGHIPSNDTARSVS